MEHYITLVNVFRGNKKRPSLIEADNRKHKGTHGSMLERIYNVTYELAERADILVRERGFSRLKKDTQTLFKVLGITDMAAWRAKGTASKAEVAAALERYVARQEYACDDLSDAVAVGMT